MTDQKKGFQIYSSSLIQVLTISAWGVVIGVVSIVFLYLGYLLDECLGTAPNFMFGLFFLAVVSTIYRFFREAWKRRNDM